MNLRSYPAAHPRAVVMAGVFFVSLSAILIKLSNAPSLVIAAYRMTFTVFLMAPTFASGVHSRKTAPSGRDMVLAGISGVFLAVHFAAWISSLKYTTVASATVLVNTQPLFIVVLAFFFLGERISRRALFWMLFAFAGSAVISVGGGDAGGSNPLTGNLLATGGALASSGYMLIGRALRQRLSAGAYSFMVYLTSAVLLVAFVVATGKPLFTYPPVEYLIFVGLAVFPTLLGHNLFNWSLGYLKPSFVSVAILGEPVFSTILALIIFVEIPTVYTIIGGAAVISGIYFFLKAENRSPVAL